MISSRKRIAVLELLADAAPRGWDRVYASQFRRHFVSITPQAVAAWCRQLGHDVFYATYYGQADPAGLVPGDLDVIFVSAYTKASALAYTLARLFKRRGALTVLGGPHARAFPGDCLRFFDIVVDTCDQTLVDDIVRGRFDPPALVASRRPLTDLPSVEERMPELRASSLRGRTIYRVVPILASVGCPYTCDFCVDWRNDYVRLPADRLARDLAFVARRHPDALVAYHDPNFGVQFEQTLDAIESVPDGSRNPYIIESSLSVLKPSRLDRLRRTRCAYVVAGVESWADYSNKSGSGRALTGWDKLEKVAAHFHALHECIPGFQANFVFGTDADRGTEPLELTKEFVRRVPFAWPGVNIPTPFGGTPFFDRLLDEDRILRAMPFAFYYDPYLTFVPAHYSPVASYDLLIDLFSLVTSREMWLRRLTGRMHPLVKFVHAVQAFGMRHELAALKRLRARIAGSAELRGFHDGRSTALPEFYHHHLETMLGRYAELLSRADRTPLHEVRHPSSDSIFAMGFLLRLLVNAAALWVATRVVPGVSYDGQWLPFFGVALVFGVVNAIIRPITKVLTFPIIIVTLGIFIFVINGLMLWLTSSLSAALGLGFHVAGFGAAFFGALVVSVVSMILSMVVRDGDRRVQVNVQTR